ncbi:MAG: cytochrome b [Burkholderiaceae bacterium]
MQRYTRTAIVLHWLVALLIISGFVLGVTMVNIPGLTPSKLRYFSWHKWIGITVLALACVRLIWRVLHPAPPYPDTLVGWQHTAARVIHTLLYFLIFAVPVSGYFYTLAAGVPVVYLGVVSLPVLIDPNPEWKPVLKQVHYWLNISLLAGFCIHVGGALKHQLIDHDGLMRRMLPGHS